MGKNELIRRCIICKHYYDFGNFRACAAFKDIPNEIFTGSNDHTHPLKDQDNNIIFEEKDVE